MRLPVLLFSILSLIVFVHAVDIVGQIQWNDICANVTALGNAGVTLDEGATYSSITADGKFTIPDVSDGTYLLSLISRNYAFEQFRVDVINTHVEVRPYVPGTPWIPPPPVLLPYPLVVAPIKKLEFFMPRENFNLKGMLSNPMMLIMIFGGVLMLATPYIMNNLDLETLEEMKKEQARMSDAVQQGDVKSGYSASSVMDDNVRPNPSPSKTAPRLKAKSLSKKSKR